MRKELHTNILYDQYDDSYDSDGSDACGDTTATETTAMTAAEMTDSMTVMAVAATITIMIPTIISGYYMTFGSRAAISLCEAFWQWSDSFALFWNISK